MQKKAYQANKKPVQPTAAAMMSSQNAATCTFRKGLHSTASCGIVTDVSMQKGILPNNGRCFICLKKNQPARRKSDLGSQRIRGATSPED